MVDMPKKTTKPNLSETISVSQNINTFREGLHPTVYSKFERGSISSIEKRVGYIEIFYFGMSTSLRKEKVLNSKCLIQVDYTSLKNCRFLLVMNGLCIYKKNFERFS